MAHWIKWLTNWEYREATRIADEANRKFAEVMAANMAIMEGKK